jgi:hypothetical protein
VYGTNASGYISLNTPSFTHTDPRHLKVEMKKDLLQVTNLLYGTQSKLVTQIEYTMTSNLYILAQNYNGTARMASYGTKLRVFSYYDKNDNLICDLVPCYRKSDGVIGMYDVVRKIFLTCAGSGALSKGPDVL